MTTCCQFQRNDVIRGRRKGAQTGAALVIAILVLFVLTVLGLALMLTTAVEADLSVNHRWSEMAFFNAEAGLEYGKNVLAGYALANGNFQNALPPVRTDMTQPPPGFCNPGTDGCRDFQYSIQQGNVTLFVGQVLREPGSPRVLQYDYRTPGALNNLAGGDLTPGDTNGDGAADLPGTVTIWVRRPILNGRDDPNNSVAVITAEGTAPNYESAATGRAGAIQRLEMTVAIGAAGPGGGSVRSLYKTRARNTDGSDTSNLTQQRTITEGQ